jgi:hypothetical protein
MSNKIVALRKIVGGKKMKREFFSSELLLSKKKKKLQPHHKHSCQNYYHMHSMHFHHNHQ